MDSPSPSIQPGVNETERGEAKTPSSSKTQSRLSSMKSSPRRRDSTSSTTPQSGGRTPRPGHVIRDGHIGTLCPIEVRDTPGTGQGLFATQAVPRYTLLFAEEPLLFAPRGGGRVGNHKMRKLLEALDQLPAKRRADFQSLYWSPSALQAAGADSDNQDRMRSWYAQLKGLEGAELDEAVAAGLVALTIYRTNNVATMDSEDLDEITVGVVYSVFSRINHACDAKAAFFYLGVRSQCLGVRAMRDIAAGEQIFVSYIGDKAAKKMTLEERRDSLASWGFECRCDTCVKEEKAEEMAKKKEAEK
ncbi:hypothetical protein PG994_000851 [Apiospora phragmitis]|uniref:SET domain-containing protein n=1 Tax=Apiospora phragmitis TaxID=2905665 RepID=A0ABR1X7H3_9PEZI